MRPFAFLLAITIAISGCSTGRDMTSANYLPDWENRVFNFPSPSETSGGNWAVKTAGAVGKGIGKTLMVPFALLGNIAMNLYYIPTWPFRWAFRGDKRLIVWKPIFNVGSDIGSPQYSKEWNRDLA